MNQTNRYSATAKSLHWFLAVVIILMLIAGRTLEDMDIPERTEILMAHSGLGTLVLVLMLVRLVWRQTHQPPAPDSSVSALQVKLSKLMHRTLYALIILQPILGILQAAYLDEYKVIAFGLIDYSAIATDNAGMAKVFHIMHGINATVISILVLGHIGAAFYHHFVQKDQTLKRMLPYGKVD